LRPKKDSELGGIVEEKKQRANIAEKPRTLFLEGRITFYH
jgi:hypothetical protein